MAKRRNPSLNQTMVKPEDVEIVDAYLESLRQRGFSADTIKLRRKILQQLSRDLTYGVGETDADELKAWLYRPSWGLSTWATYLAGLRSFYRWAANPRDAWISEDPTADLESLRPPEAVARPCTDEQLAHILTKAVEPYRTWSVLAARQGLRCIEISGLNREHVTRSTLHVVRGKGGRPRVHDTDPMVWEVIAPLPPGPVARLVRTGDRASAGYISVRAAHYFQNELGLEGVTLHRLRHWLGVNIQRLYRDIRVTQEVLGHKTVASTQIYTMASMEQQREARAMLPRLSRGDG